MSGQRIFSHLRAEINIHDHMQFFFRDAICKHMSLGHFGLVRKFAFFRQHCSLVLAFSLCVACILSLSEYVCGVDSQRQRYQGNHLELGGLPLAAVPARWDYRKTT